jgi:hypothetical protein
MDDIQLKLRRMIEKEGLEVVTLAGICDLMLKKYLPEHPEAVRALALCVDRGVAQQIRLTPNAMAREMMLPNWLQLLADTGLKPDQARWVIDAWADAIDAVPERPIVNPYEDDAKKKKGPADVDAALLYVFLFGMVFHVLVLIGFSFVVELYIDPDVVDLTTADILTFYAVMLPAAAGVSFLIFMALTAMYGQANVPIDRYLRNFLCLFSFASAAFMFAILISTFIYLIIAMFFAAGTISWLLRFYGFRVFIITSVMHLAQYAVYFVLISIGAVLPFHDVVQPNADAEKREEIKRLFERMKRRGGWIRPGENAAPGAAALVLGDWPGSLLASAPPPPELLAQLFQKRAHARL